MTITISKAALWAAAGIVGAGAAGGVTYAAIATPAAASSGMTAGTASATSSAAAGATAAGGRAGRLGGRALLKHLEHGELTVKTPKGDRTVDLQRGTVTAVSSGAISVKSDDGFPGSYTVTSATKVRGKTGREAITAVHKGDKVLVAGVGGTALRIVDRG